MSETAAAKTVLFRADTVTNHKKRQANADASSSTLTRLFFASPGQPLEPTSERQSYRLTDEASVPLQPLTTHYP